MFNQFNCFIILFISKQICSCVEYFKWILKTENVDIRIILKHIQNCGIMLIDGLVWNIYKYDNDSIELVEEIT